MSSFYKKVNMLNYADFVFHFIYLIFKKSFLPLRRQLLQIQNIIAIFHPVLPES